MATLTTVARVLRLDRVRWSGVEDGSWPAAAALVVVASVLVTFGRFGGLTFDAPRSFVRVTLVGVWGWIALSAAVWIVLTATAATGRRRSDRSTATPTPRPSLVLALVGLAHLPLLVLAIVMVVSAMMFEWREPGRAVAVATVAAWFPASLVAALRGRIGMGAMPAVAVVLIPYAGWLAVVATAYHRQIGHLL